MREESWRTCLSRSGRWQLATRAIPEKFTGASAIAANCSSPIPSRLLFRRNRGNRKPCWEGKPPRSGNSVSTWPCRKSWLPSAWKRSTCSVPAVRGRCLCWRGSWEIVTPKSAALPPGRWGRLVPRRRAPFPSWRSSSTTRMRTPASLRSRQYPISAGYSQSNLRPMSARSASMVRAWPRESAQFISGACLASRCSATVRASLA